jgi:uncharacterized protein
VDFGGSVEIKAPRERVWEFVNDPQQVAGCGPGVESVEVIDADHCNALAKIVVGPVNFKFDVRAVFTQRRPPEHATVEAHAKAPGTMVDGVAQMHLRDGEAAGTTVMDWTASVQFSGKVASLGARLIQGTAEKMIGQTFTCIKARLEE